MDETRDAVVPVQRMIDLPGLRMSVTEAGTGEPILLLHGFPQSSREWERVMPRLARHAHVIAPDLRGAGLTDAPRRGYERRTLQADVEALLDALALDRVTIVAHDWSALIAFALAIEKPERVERLIALAVPPPYLRFHPRLMKAMPVFAFQFALATPVIGPALLRRGRQRLPRWLMRRFAARPDAISERDAYAYLTALAEPARARAGSALYRGLIVPEFIRILAGAYRGHRLAVPAVVLFGADDSLIPRQMLTGFEVDAPHLTIEYVPGAVHFLPDEQPADIARRISEFIAHA
jgi:pimeloyl-ACP methyl ester carboxylesterase